MALFYFAMGVIAMSIEFSVPGIGIFALTSMLCYLASLYYFLGATTTALYIVTGLLIIGILLFILLIRKFSNRFDLKNIKLLLQFTSDKGYISTTEKESLVGKRGIAVSVLRPSGVGEFEGKRLDIVTEGVFLEKDTPIEIVQVEGSRIIVKKLD